MKFGKIIGTMLSVVIAAGIVFAVPQTESYVTVCAEDGFIIETDSDGDKYITGYNGNGGDIVIPDDVTWVGKQAFFGNRDITSVTFPANCWYWVDKQAFAFCPNLKQVTFNGSIGGIGEEAFFACTALEKVNFGGNISYSSKGGIGSYAFSFCMALRSVNFSDPDAVVDMLGGCAFSDCIKLNSIDLPSGLAVIRDDVFVNCAALTSIEIPSHTKIDGTHVFGYMYGKSSSGYSYIKADGSTKCSIYYWKEENGNYSESNGNITQKVMTITCAKGSDAAKYAESEGIACSYTDEIIETAAEKLPAPQNVKTKKSNGNIVITWDDVDGAEGYRIYMFNEETGKYAEYKSVRTAQCTVEDAESGREYRFIVAALDSKDGKYVRGRTSKTVAAET